jgi:hypothetical protein
MAIDALIERIRPAENGLRLEVWRCDQGHEEPLG